MGQNSVLKEDITDIVTFFVFKTYNRKKYVFYSVNHYTERDEKYKSEYLVPGPRIGRAYRDWMNADKVQFY